MSPEPSVETVALNLGVQDPTTIVICSWTGARIEHASKYAYAYRQMFPNAPIIILTTSVLQILGPCRFKRENQMTEALGIIKSHQPTGGRGAGILLHALSNGGSFKACELAKTYYNVYEQPLPVSMLYLDSTPGIPRFLPDCLAVCKTLTTITCLQYLCCAPASLALGMVWAWYHTCDDFENNPISKTYHDLLNSEYFEPGRMKIGYMYSSRDKTVSAGDIQAHMRLANVAKYAIKTKEFSSAHVKHAKDDPNGYWSFVHGMRDDRVIKQTWDDIEVDTLLCHHRHGIWKSQPPGP